MSTNLPKRRWSGPAVIGAICGGASAASVSMTHRVASHGPGGLAWQDIGLAFAIVLIVVALVALIAAARRRPS